MILGINTFWEIISDPSLPRRQPFDRLTVLSEVEGASRLLEFYGFPPSGE
jgi:hypothetical protein